MCVHAKMSDVCKLVFVTQLQAVNNSGCHTEETVRILKKKRRRRRRRRRTTTKEMQKA